MNIFILGMKIFIDLWVWNLFYLSYLQQQNKIENLRFM